jgi:hypothetical protein
MEEEAVIAPGTYRNKMNTTVRDKARELEKMKRDLVAFLTFYLFISDLVIVLIPENNSGIIMLAHVTNRKIIFQVFNLTE